MKAQEAPERPVGDQQGEAERCQQHQADHRWAEQPLQPHAELRRERAQQAGEGCKGRDRDR